MVRDTPLRRARLAQGLTIDDVAARTRLSPRLVALLDEGRFHELPGGLYARSYVRAFATATGIDPNATVSRVEALLPGVPDPVAALRDSIGGAPDQPPLLVDLQRLWTTLQARAVASLYGPGPRDQAREIAGRSAAAVADTLALVAINGLLLGAVAAFCGTSLFRLLEHAGPSAAIFSALVSALYYVIFAGVAGRTPGAWLWQRPAETAAGPLRPAAIFKRAGRAWLNGASIAVDVAFTVDRSRVRSLIARLDEVRERTRARAA